MGALFGECVLNRESHYIRRWRLTNTSDTIVILSLTHQTKFGLIIKRNIIMEVFCETYC